MKIAVVGATGLVGQEMISGLERVDFEITELMAVASSRSVGKKVVFKGDEITVISIDEAISRKPDLALFSAGGELSLQEAPRFATAGIKVIDNSSAWRMDPDVKLIVPEINAHELRKGDMIIANPNCSTIQMVVALGPIHKKYGINRLVISTYQSYTGTGKKAVDQYSAEKSGEKYNGETAAYPYEIFENVIPQCDDFLENDYTKEEMKLVHETRKIIGDDAMRITATAVRVPVHGGHSESVNIEMRDKFDIKEVISILEQSEGVTVLDDPKNLKYPMPRYAYQTNEVYVGRIRRDESIDNGLNMWIVSDNLRKGAATNTIQIAEYLLKNNLLK